MRIFLVWAGAVALAWGGCGRVGFDEVVFANGTDASTGADASLAESRPRTLAVYDTHSCAIVAEEVWCWGQGTEGQLGVGEFESSNVPVRVTLPSRPLSVDVGHQYSCVLTEEREVYCWGDSLFRQNGLDAPTAVPNQIVAPPAKALTTGFGTACILAQDNTIWCWGDNTRGSMGVGSSTVMSSTDAMQVELTNAEWVDCGGLQCCGVDATHTAYCWGHNLLGALGIGSTESQIAPQPVVGFGGEVARAYGGRDHTCLVLTDGSLVCQGGNWGGQLGDGTSVMQTTPILVEGLPAVDLVTLGHGYSCILGVGSGVPVCWGENALGRLGTGDEVGLSEPTTVTALGGLTDLVGETGHTCARTITDQVMCWGAGELGQLGNGANSNSLTPVTAVFE